jgi:hypothetical protein
MTWIIILKKFANCFHKAILQLYYKYKFPFQNLEREFIIYENDKISL